MGSTLELRQSYRAEWQRILEHPFVSLLHSNKISLDSQLEWALRQYHYLEAWAYLRSALVPRAPQPHRLFIAQLLIFTVEELDWLSQLELPTDRPPHPVIHEYHQYLQELELLSYPEILIIHWLLQKVFMDAWLSAQPEQGPLAEFYTLWSAPEYRGLLHDLNELTEMALGRVDLSRLDPWILRGLHLEEAFWGTGLELIRGEGGLGPSAAPDP
jgi:thiaminase